MNDHGYTNAYVCGIEADAAFHLANRQDYAQMHNTKPLHLKVIREGLGFFAGPYAHGKLDDLFYIGWYRALEKALKNGEIDKIATIELTYFPQEKRYISKAFKQLGRKYGINVITPTYSLEPDQISARHLISCDNAGDNHTPTSNESAMYGENQNAIHWSTDAKFAMHAPATMSVLDPRDEALGKFQEKAIRAPLPTKHKKQQLQRTELKDDAKDDAADGASDVSAEEMALPQRTIYGILQDEIKDAHPPVHEAYQERVSQTLVTLETAATKHLQDKYFTDAIQNMACLAFGQSFAPDRHSPKLTKHIFTIFQHIATNLAGNSLEDIEKARPMIGKLIEQTAAYSRSRYLQAPRYFSSKHLPLLVSNEAVDALIATEIQIFFNAQRNIIQKSSIDPIKAAALAVMDELQKVVAQDKWQDIDLQAIQTHAEAVTTLIQSKHTPQDVEQYAKSAQHHRLSPGVSKAMVVLGLIALVGSVIAFFATAGLSSPVSLLGMKLGIDLLIVSGVGAGLAIGGACSLFARSNLQKAQDTFIEEVKNSSAQGVRRKLL